MYTWQVNFLVLLILPALQTTSSWSAASAIVSSFCMIHTHLSPSPLLQWLLGKRTPSSLSLRSVISALSRSFYSNCLNLEDCLCIKISKILCAAEACILALIFKTATLSSLSSTKVVLFTSIPSTQEMIFFLACHSNSVIHLSASALIYLLSNGVRKVPLHLRDCMAKIIYNS